MITLSLTMLNDANKTFSSSLLGYLIEELGRLAQLAEHGIDHSRGGGSSPPSSASHSNLIWSINNSGQITEATTGTV